MGTVTATNTTANARNPSAYCPAATASRIAATVTLVRKRVIGETIDSNSCGVVLAPRRMR